jgi:hypothetical protein
VLLRRLNRCGGRAEQELAAQVLGQHVRTEAEHAEVIEQRGAAVRVLVEQRVVSEILVDRVSRPERDERNA